jgi:hypothetical protein
MSRACTGAGVVAGLFPVWPAEVVFQGLNRQQAEEVWRPFLEWVAKAPQDFAWETPV